MEEPLIRRTFTLAQDGRIHCEEHWDSTNFTKFGGVSAPNPYIREFHIERAVYEKVCRKLQGHVAAGKMRPQVYARNVFI